MPMYNLTEYSDNYSETSGILWQYCRDDPVLANNDDITDFNANNADTYLLKLKEKNNRSNRQQWHKNVEIMAPLKYLSNFWRTLEMPLIIVGTNVAAQATTFSITETKLYVPVVTLSN